MRLLKRKSRTFEIQVQEMTLHIQAATDVDEESRAAALSFWELLHTYSIRNPEFRSSKRPVKVPGDAPEIGMQAATAENQVTADDTLGPDDRGLGLGHRRQLADFIDAVTTGRAPRVGTTEARTALSVILAIYESAASGRPVTL